MTEINADELRGNTKDEIDELWEALPGNEAVNILYIEPWMQELKDEICSMRHHKFMFEDSDNDEFLKGVDTLERILEMTGNLYQGENTNMSAVGEELHGHLPGPVRALKQGSVGPVLSDMQVMAENERKQHEQTYIYEHGHNDHGMGQ